MTSLEILRHFAEETQQRDVFTKTRIDRMLTKWRVSKDLREIQRNNDDFKTTLDIARLRKANPPVRHQAAPLPFTCDCGQNFGTEKGLSSHRKQKHKENQ